MTIQRQRHVISYSVGNIPRRFHTSIQLLSFLSFVGECIGTYVLESERDLAVGIYGVFFGRLFGSVKGNGEDGSVTFKGMEYHAGGVNSVGYWGLFGFY